jgi:hypothetical protein
VLIMGGIWETAGFIIRCISILNPTSQGMFTPQFLLILLAPLWINAFDYMLFGRIVYNYLPNKKIFGIRAQRVGLVFVLLDISSFIVQLSGGLLTTNNEAGVDTINLGLHIYAAGVGFQLLVILAFATLAYSCERRLGREVEPSRAREAQKLLWVLYGTLGLIMVCIFATAHLSPVLTRHPNSSELSSASSNSPPHSTPPSQSRSRSTNGIHTSSTACPCSSRSLSSTSGIPAKFYLVLRRTFRNCRRPRRRRKRGRRRRTRPSRGSQKRRRRMEVGLVRMDFRWLKCIIRLFKDLGGWGRRNFCFPWRWGS